MPASTHSKQSPVELVTSCELQIASAARATRGQMFGDGRLYNDVWQERPVDMLQYLQLEAVLTCVWVITRPTAGLRIVVPFEHAVFRLSVQPNLVMGHHSGVGTGRRSALKKNASNKRKSPGRSYSDSQSHLGQDPIFLFTIFARHSRIQNPPCCP